LGLIGLVLAVVGLYAIVAYQVEQRTREIGIRMALGADWSQVVRMILHGAGFMGLAGVGFGFVFSLALRNALNAGAARQPLNWLVFTVVPLGLLITALLAAAIPAHRASRIDPQEALRQE